MFDSAAEFARECGVHRKTVLNWIKDGKISARVTRTNEKGRCIPRKPYQNYKIHEKNAKKIKELKSPNEKYNKWYTETEIYIMKHNKHLSVERLAKMLNRTVNSVYLKRIRLRERGIDV